MADGTCARDADTVWSSIGAGGAAPNLTMPIEYPYIKDISVPLLASLPIDVQIGKVGGEGCPFMVTHAASDTGMIFSDIAHKVSASLDISS